MASRQFELNPPPDDAVSAVKFGPGSSTKLLVSSWDKHVHLYDIRAAPGSQLIRKFEHRAPVLDVCFGKDENEIFSVGLDWDVRQIDPSTGEQTVLSTHSKPACALVYDTTNNILISASWDNTLHIHTPSASDPAKEPATLTLPSKPFALAASPSKLVVIMSTRQVHIYELSALAMLTRQASQPAPNEIAAEPFQRRESSLKFLTRCVACMPNDAGFACSSIEGRVAVEWFDASAESQARKYAFKCHRQASTDPSEAERAVDIVYPVNALAFHPVHGTFVSGGGDGVVALWDAVAKRRIRQYQKFPASVASMEFNGDGSMLAVGISPGFEEGKEDIGEGPIKVFVKELTEGEAKGKAAK